MMIDFHRNFTYFSREEESVETCRDLSRLVENSRNLAKFCEKSGKREISHSLKFMSSIDSASRTDRPAKGRSAAPSRRTAASDNIYKVSVGSVWVGVPLCY